MPAIVWSSFDDVIKVIRFDPWPLSRRWRKVYFANENVHFYQLHHESELRLPKDCFCTS